MTMSNKMRRIWMEKRIYEMEAEETSPDVEIPDLSSWTLPKVEAYYDEWFGEGASKRFGQLCLFEFNPLTKGIDKPVAPVV